MAGSTPGWLAAYRRTVVVAVLGCAALASTVVGAGAGAQASTYVDPGRANARAAVFSIAPRTGSLALAISTGAAQAETSGGLAQAFAQSIDLGLIGTSLAAEQCNGNDPIVPAEDQPQPTLADNRSGDASFETQEYPLIGSGLGAGLEIAEATLQPAGRAVSTTGNIQLSELLSIAGGSATSVAQAFEGAGREARASVDISLDLAGVHLSGLRWTALHRTGPDPVAEGGFEMEALELLGVPAPVDQVEAVSQLVNETLAPLGLRIELPRVERITEPVDLIRVTPLRILVADSPIGAQVARPALDLTRDIRSDLFEAVVAAYCPSASTLLVGEIMVGVLSGTGAFVIEIGGAEASSGDVVIEDPFATDGGPAAAPAGLPGAVPNPSGGGLPNVAPPAGLPGATATPLPAPTAVATERHCESTHPREWPSCSRGSAAGVIGIVGAAATVGVGLLDLRRRRRAAATAVVAS